MSSVEDRLTAALTITADTLREETLRPLALPERTRRRWPLVLAPVAAATAVALVVGIEVGVGRITSAHQPASGTGHAAPTVSIGKNPANIAFDAADKTIYVLNNGSQTLTMVGTAACNASTTRGCGQIRQTSAGAAYPQDVAVDEHTRTVYVLTGFQSSTVAVIDATTCNATTTSGCPTRTLVHVPRHAIELAVNPRTDAIYVFYNRLAQVSVINGQACNASDTTGCGTAVATAPAPALADTPVATVDPATNTLYYAVGNNALAVIDGRTCGAGDVRGCGNPLAIAPLAGYPTGLTIDQATGTLFATGTGPMAVTAINRNTCNALTTAGCTGPLRVIRGGPIPLDAAADPAANTVYVTGQGPDGVTMINASACRASNLSGCPQLPSRFPVGALPQPLVADAASHTLYVANQQDGTLSIINTATCNAADTRGCPRWPSAAAPLVPAGAPKYTCDRAAAVYDSGLPAGPLLKGSERVAGGSVGGLPWSVWAKKGIAAPGGIEQGGVVLNGRWYGLCVEVLMGRPRSIFELIDAGTRGIVYGFIENPQRVKITLSSGATTWSPSAVRMTNLTFFISRLPRPACAYHTMTAHFAATRKPLWSGHTTTNTSACVPGWLVVQGGGSGAWGPGLGN